MDTDFSAKISFEEFKTAMSATMQEQDEAMLKSSFRRLDSNGDQFLTMDEIIGTLTKNEDSLHRIRKTQGFIDEVR